jgi:hypothetical protein
VVALFVDVVGAEGPVGVEGMLNAAGDVDGVGSLVAGVDDVGGSSGGVARDAAGIFGILRVGDGIDAGAG